MSRSKCERQNYKLRKTLEDIVRLFEEHKKIPISENQAAFIAVAEMARKALKKSDPIE
jgi:hypothetical protein